MTSSRRSEPGTTRRSPKRARKVVTADAAERRYAIALESGSLPSIRRIRSDLHVGQQRGPEIREHLGTLAR